MKTTIYTEPNEFPADFLPRGEFVAKWQGYYLMIYATETHTQMSVAFPGAVTCTAVVTDETISIVVELAP